MSTKENWSKYGSGGINELRKRVLRKSPSVVEYVYGYLIAAQGEGSYNGDFSGIRVLAKFDKENLNTLSKFWFPLDITYEDFVSTFSDIESFNSRIASSEKIYCVLTYKPPNIYTGKISIAGNLNFLYDLNHKNSSDTIGAIVNGFKSPTSSTRKTLKAISSKNVNSGISLTSNEVKITGSSRNFITVNDAGIQLSADSFSIQSTPNNFKFAGIISLQNVFMGLIPSTGATPISQYTFSLPIDGLTDLTDIASVITSIVGT